MPILFISWASLRDRCAEWPERTAGLDVKPVKLGAALEQDRGAASDWVAAPGAVPDLETLGEVATETGRVEDCEELTSLLDWLYSSEHSPCLRQSQQTSDEAGHSELVSQNAGSFNSLNR